MRSRRKGSNDVKSKKRIKAAVSQERSEGRIEAGASREGMLAKGPGGSLDPPQVCVRMEQRADGSTHGR